MLKALTCCLIVVSAVAPGRELLLNGNFELPPDSGWREVAWGEFTDTGNCRLRWRHDHEPDRDFEVMVHKMLNQGFALTQRVDIPDLDLVFSASARLTSKTENFEYYAAAAVCLEYLDSHDSVIGETRIYSATSQAPWRSTPVLHLIGAPDSLSWHHYRLDLQSELANLPGVEAESIRAVNVKLLAYVDRNG
jgi:hypothetical protein